MIIDRYILVRFLVSFVILFTLLFLFAVAIDLILNLDRFIDATHDRVGDVPWYRLTWLVIIAMVDFQAPRIFQFYAYLHGIVAVGAMGFTLVQMYRYKELVALMSAGISLHRIAMPFFVAVFGLSFIQLLNQELILPRVASMVLRDHRHIGEESIEAFPLPLTTDGRGAVFHAALFTPGTQELDGLTILERDPFGRTQRRIVADRARWSAEGGGAWILEGGTAVRPPDAGAGILDRRPGPETIASYRTDLNPDLITARRYGQYMAMLSLRQIGSMLRTPGFDDADAVRDLRRQQFARFASVLVNLLVMWLALPAFLLREPSDLLRQSVVCAAVAIPATFGAAVMMSVDLPGIAPAVGVFLPVVVLGPIALARWTFLRT